MKGHHPVGVDALLEVLMNGVLMPRLRRWVSSSFGDVIDCILVELICVI